MRDGTISTTKSTQSGNPVNTDTVSGVTSATEKALLDIAGRISRARDAVNGPQPEKNGTEAVPVSGLAYTTQRNYSLVNHVGNQLEELFGSLGI